MPEKEEAMLTISGAYGRDYNSRAAVEADFAADKDFTVRAGGRGYTNRSDLRAMGVREVTVRYSSDRKVMILRIA